MSVRKAKFTIELDQKNAYYGLYVERNAGPMDRTWDWPRLQPALRERAELQKGRPRRNMACAFSAVPSRELSVRRRYSTTNDENSAHLRATFGCTSALICVLFSGQAYQTHLLPHTLPADIRRLNYLALDTIAGEGIDVESEIERALMVSQSLAATESTKIHFVANIMEVVLNVHQWNRA